MGLFSRKKPDMKIAPPSTSRVEVELHKSASEDAVQKAKQANEHLNDLLVANGFTLKIYLAAGGQPPKKKRGGN